MQRVMNAKVIKEGIVKVYVLSTGIKDGFLLPSRLGIKMRPVLH